MYLSGTALPVQIVLIGDVMDSMLEHENTSANAQLFA